MQRSPLLMGGESGHGSDPIRMEPLDVEPGRAITIAEPDPIQLCCCGLRCDNTRTKVLVL